MRLLVRSTDPSPETAAPAPLKLLPTLPRGTRRLLRVRAISGAPATPPAVAIEEEDALPLTLPLAPPCAEMPEGFRDNGPGPMTGVASDSRGKL